MYRIITANKRHFPFLFIIYCDFEKTFHKYPYKKERNYLKSLTHLISHIFNELKFANSRYMNSGKKKKNELKIISNISVNFFVRINTRPNFYCIFFHGCSLDVRTFKKNPCLLDKRRMRWLGRDFLVPRLHRKHVLRTGNGEVGIPMFSDSYRQFWWRDGTQLEV